MSSTRSRARLPELRADERRPGVFYGDITGPDPHFRAELRALMEAGARRVCDVGGGATPVIGPNGVSERELEYVVFDASQGQLDRTPAGYELFLGDATDQQSVARLVAQHGSFDLVVSRWTAEHMRDGRRFHENVYSMLRPGGTAVHLFPTLYSLPFVANRLLAQDFSRALHTRVFPRSRTKFPAYYSWCRGPTRRQLARIESVGFQIERYVGFFGHGLYARVRPLGLVDRALTRVLLERPLPSLTSFAVAVLVRPA